MPQRLTRDRKNAVLGGVAAGLGEHLGVDPVLVRLVFVLLALLNGFGVVAYVVCWVIMPRKEEPGAGATSGAAGPAPPATPGAAAPAASSAPEAAGPATSATPADRVAEEVNRAGERLAGELRSVGPRERRGRVVAGAILVVLGMVFLLDRMWWWRWPHWLRPANLWPIVLMAIGASIIWQALRGTRK